MKMKFSRNCMKVGRGHLPYHKYGYRNSQDFRSTFGFVLVWFLGRLMCHSLVWFIVMHSPPPTNTFPGLTTPPKNMQMYRYSGNQYCYTEYRIRQYYSSRERDSRLQYFLQLRGCRIQLPMTTRLLLIAISSSLEPYQKDQVSMTIIVLADFQPTHSPPHERLGSQALQPH